MISFGDFTTSEPLREILENPDVFEKKDSTSEREDIPVWDASKKVVKEIKVKTAAQVQKDAYAVNKEEKEMMKVQEEEWGVGHNPTNFVIKTRPIRSKNARRRENKQIQKERLKNLSNYPIWSERKEKEEFSYNPEEFPLLTKIEAKKETKKPDPMMEELEIMGFINQSPEFLLKVKKILKKEKQKLKRSMMKRLTSGKLLGGSPPKEKKPEEKMMEALASKVDQGAQNEVYRQAQDGRTSPTTTVMGSEGSFQTTV